MRLQILAVVLLALSTVSADAGQPLSMAVSPTRSFAPANLTIRIHVEPDGVDRTIEVVAESGEYYRSSSIQLDGSEEPRTIWVEFRDVPGGNYDVHGTLISRAGNARAAVHQHVVVLDPAGAGATP